jgi:hypothetical protein
MDILGKAKDLAADGLEKVKDVAEGGVEKVKDLAHDGVQAVKDATDGDPETGKGGFLDGLKEKAVNVAEKVTNRDLNGDGTIGG